MALKILARMLVLFAFLLPSSFVIAGSLDDLEYFYQRVASFSARFEQVVLDENLNRVEESSGWLWIDRPGRFRWDYEPPLEQQIISDGESIWVFDVELETITVRNLSQAIGRTPAILLAGRGELEQSYIIEDRGLHGKVNFVALIPKDNDGNFSEMQLGFEDGQLRQLQLADQLGQITRIVFSDNAVNPSLEATLFDFAPPPGVDVIDYRE